MPQMRRDPVTGRWVIIAKNRAGRPNEFSDTVRRRTVGPSPFEEGNEQKTPGEILAFRQPDTRPDGPGWRVRVVPNKYPAFLGFGQPQTPDDPLYAEIPALGAHEVIIESPRHSSSISDLTDEQAAEVFFAYRQRLGQQRADPRMAYGLIFKNVGPGAGASIEHAHSQLVAMPVVPDEVSREQETARLYFQENGRTLYEEVLARELADESRVVCQTERFVAFCPFASRFPYQVWILPRRQAAHFDEASDEALCELAQIIRRLVKSLEQMLSRPAYNYLIATAPFDSTAEEHYHWRMEVFPRITKTAGFEWATGCFINPVPPEEAAARLREMAEKQDSTAAGRRGPAGNYSA